MKHKRSLLLSLPITFAGICLCFAQDSLPQQRADASSGTPRPEKASFIPKHDSFLARGKSGPIGVLFLGDSITERWNTAPEIWERYYGKLQPANFGIGGDQTQNVIWRIEHGELDGIYPKVVVLMLGTNNSGLNSAKEIADADTKIVNMILEKCPETKVLLLAIFPRGPRGKAVDRVDDAKRRMATINEANSALGKLDNGKNVFFLDIDDKFCGADGKIPDEIMPDQLHPSPAGYQIWADSMQQKLEELMNQK